MTDEGYELVTKANGQVVKIYPDGRTYLVSTHDKVAQGVADKLTDNLQGDETLRQKQMSEIVAKREQSSGGDLPPEKTPL